MTVPKEKADSFEEKLAKLEAIVAWFESEEVTLQASMQQFEEGMKLAQQLEKELHEAENRVTRLKAKFAKAE